MVFEDRQIWATAAALMGAALLGEYNAERLLSILNPELLFLCSVSQIYIRFLLFFFFRNSL